ncbi:hypothetical protein SODALDRAFT_357978 [Sodiomyces alkalinus F11]|uniref:Protein kinase domain-containing protein n=1 Tax=Sodiomyces alkalinus (strain CBS 110278 / VKM F-3762 / F11) TaxID=1314773 RepID=A0A3N2PYZ7_SODAK|nr:hypothetical protein SODALDRAFT_357978 [Sodiomyces alkalinus F11]ROT39575.1 hypothetical protein SODALDRAFT_357978 [Sodiomyces alkalinus F11]
MSTIQQLKNFIRHGKHARVNHYDEPQPKQQAAPTQTQRVHAEPVMTDPSTAPVDSLNRSGVESSHAHSTTTTTQHATPGATKTKNNIDSAEIARLVAEENEARNKFPTYPGLERWVLLEKMGDGAFSNVYRARDTHGQYGEVGVKVVRKYEMNNMQVSCNLAVALSQLACFLASTSCIRSQKLQRCEKLSYISFVFELRGVFDFWGGFPLCLLVPLFLFATGLLRMPRARHAWSTGN